jgi:hypothetical protein
MRRKRENKIMLQYGQISKASEANLALENFSSLSFVPIVAIGGK